MVGGIDAMAFGLKSLQVLTTIEYLVNVEKKEKLIEGICRAEARLGISILESGTPH